MFRSRAAKGRLPKCSSPAATATSADYTATILVADLALAWIAAGAKREGLRLKRTARLSQKLDTTAVVLHDPHGESSNLWGAFDRVRRNLPRLRLHFACKGL